MTCIRGFGCKSEHCFNLKTRFVNCMCIIYIYLFIPLISLYLCLHNVLSTDLIYRSSHYEILLIRTFAHSLSLAFWCLHNSGNKIDGFYFSLVIFWLFGIKTPSYNIAPVGSITKCHFRNSLQERNYPWKLGLPVYLYGKISKYSKFIKLGNVRDKNMYIEKEQGHSTRYFGTFPDVSLYSNFIKIKSKAFHMNLSMINAPFVNLHFNFVR
jgi:hypothetical protein